MCYKMSSIPSLDRGVSRLLNSKCLVQTFLLLGAVFRSYGANDDWQSVRYDQHRHYNRGPGPNGWETDVVVDIVYPALSFENSFPSESPTCLPIGDYRNGTVGYAVCKIDTPLAVVETMVRTTIINNITGLSVGFQESSSKEMSHSGFQCLRFSIRIQDQEHEERDVRVSNLVTIPCPDFSFASLFYPHPHLNFVQIYGLPLHQDPNNATHSCPTFSNLEVLDLHYNGLTSSPFSSCPAYFNNLQYAMIENQKLVLEDKPLFTLWNHLIGLSLQYCFLQNVPRSTFRGLFQLKMLNISNNNISSFKTETFHDLTNLIELRIDNNGLTTLDMSLFERLKSLQYLYLSGNHLSILDGEVTILSSLLFIDLSYNKLTVVRTELFRNSSLLTCIDLTSNCINNIESGAFSNMTSFSALVIAMNELIYVNPCNWFEGIAGIKILVLAYNNISIVEGLQCLPYMQIFNLFGNELSIIPLLRNLVTLELLDLGRNAIHGVTGDEFITVTSLKYLLLDGNEMLRLGVLSNSSSIEVIYMGFNNLSYIPRFCFNGLQSLKTLNLSYNFIKYLGAFAFPEKLQKLSLSGNQLSDLDNMNKHLPQLDTLEISHNSLTRFNISISNVVNFDISDNPLQNLSLQLSTRMPKVQNIFLENLGIGHNGKINPDLFGKLHLGYGAWHHVSLARNRISKLDQYSMLLGVTGALDYSHNPLKSIHEYPDLWFVQKYLYLNNCLIESIAPLAFQYMKRLIYVDFKGNYIQHFPQMSPADDIEYDLRNNPIVCSCHLRWLHGHPTRSNYLFTNCVDLVTESLEVFDLVPRDRLVCQHEVNCAQECICFGMDIYTVSIIKCSSRSLTAIPHKLSPAADVIYLDHNQFRKPHFASDLDRMAASQLFLQNSEIHFLEQEVFSAFPLLQTIDLSYNELDTLNMDVFYRLSDLKKLFLHGNHIHHLHGGAARYNLPDLQKITLHENELDVVPAIIDNLVGSTSFINLTLAGNPWECVACTGPILRKWLAQHADIVSDAANIHCNKSQLPVLDINMNTVEYAQCVNATHTLTNTRWGITAGLTACMVLILISLLLTYCFRHHILVLLYNNFDFLKRRRRELDVPYDVRVIYDETDERIRQWIVGELLQVLDVEWGLDVFLVERDMLAGGNHAEEIAQSIHQSRRTLIVVSQNFVENEWAQFAYQAAFQFQIENNLHRVLVVAWEPVETDTMEYNIKVYFDTKQVMCRTSRRFWPVLRSKLPLGKENIAQNQEHIQLNLLHNNHDDWKQIENKFAIAKTTDRQPIRHRSDVRRCISDQRLI